MQIQKMTAEDWPSICAIYLEGIATGDATFETSAPQWKQWDADHIRECRLVARSDESGEIAGWAALTHVSGRCVYAGVAEVSVYVAEHMRGQKIGQQLLAALVGESEKHGIWTLQAGIFPENTASIAIHRRCGFRIVGTREKLGKMNGRWRDVLLMERRSKIIR